ncbi:MAG TPA: hypothetical protein V6D00_11430 [Pantanalinema sp.]
MLTRLARLAMALVVLLLMGAARLPIPCVGDGQGNPCAVTSCVCDASCSCKFACEAAAKHKDPHAACHLAAGMPADHDAGPAHSTLPRVQAPTLLAGPFVFRTISPRSDRWAPPVGATYHPPFLAIAEPPPRSNLA